SRNGSLLASASWDQTVRVWETASGRGVMTVKGHVDQVTAVTFLGDRLASGSADNTVQVWDVIENLALVRVVTKGSGASTSLAFRPDGQVLGATPAEGGASLWDLTAGRAAGTLTGESKENLRAVALQSAGEYLAGASGSSWDSIKKTFVKGTVTIWD